MIELHVPETMAELIIPMFKVHRTGDNLLKLSTRGKHDKLKRLRMVTKETETISKEMRHETQGQGLSVSAHIICLFEPK